MTAARKTTAKKTAASSPPTFTREQAMQSVKYRACRDVLGVVLKDGAQYTAEEIETIKDEFLQRPLQEKVNEKGE